MTRTLTSPGCDVKAESTASSGARQVVPLPSSSRASGSTASQGRSPSLRAPRDTPTIAKPVQIKSKLWMGGISKGNLRGNSGRTSPTAELTSSRRVRSVDGESTAFQGSRRSRCGGGSEMESMGLRDGNKLAASNASDPNLPRTRLCELPLTPFSSRTHRCPAASPRRTSSPSSPGPSSPPSSPVSSLRRTTAFSPPPAPPSLPPPLPPRSHTRTRAPKPTRATPASSSSVSTSPTRSSRRTLPSRRVLRATFTLSSGSTVPSSRTKERRRSRVTGASWRACTIPTRLEKPASSTLWSYGAGSNASRMRGSGGRTSGSDRSCSSGGR